MEAYKKLHPQRVDRRHVLDFLLFESHFPRTVRYASLVTADFAKRLAEMHGARGKGVERAFGKLAGHEVKVSGQLGRDGAKKLYVRSVERPDGTRLATGRSDTAAPDPNIVTADPDRQYGYGASGNDYPVDITGVWRNSYKFRVTVDDLTPKPTPFTAEGRQLFAATEYWHDAALRCLAPGLPRVFGSPYNMEIVDAGTHYLVVFMQDNTPRRVWMDGRKPPAEQPLTSMGFSTGKWEGRTLVIETTMLLPGWLDGSGYPMTGGDGTRIVERWTPAADGLTMERIMTVTDKAYTQPLVRTRGSQRGDATVGLIESEPCDARPFYNELLERGELEQRLKPQ